MTKIVTQKNGILVQDVTVTFLMGREMCSTSKGSEIKCPQKEDLLICRK